MKLLSKIIIVTVIAALLIWDFVAMLIGGVKATISNVIWDWASQFPVVGFLFGLVAGHLFWPVGG